MYYVYELRNAEKISVDALARVCPTYFQFLKSDNVTLLKIEASHWRLDQATAMAIDEMARIYFLTGINIFPEFTHTELPDGAMVYSLSLGIKQIITADIPGRLINQQWTETLRLQLSLWKLACTDDLPLSAEINLLFQVIEAKFHDRKDINTYPRYECDSEPPAPLTECKLLRDLASHQGKINGKELKVYCKHLGLPEQFHNPNDAQVIKILEQKRSLLRQQARNIIEQSISYKTE